MAAAELILGLAFALGGTAPSGDGRMYPELSAIYERDKESGEQAVTINNLMLPAVMEPVLPTAPDVLDHTFAIFSLILPLKDIA